MIEQNQRRPGQRHSFSPAKFSGYVDPSAQIQLMRESIAICGWNPYRILRWSAFFLFLGISAWAGQPQSLHNSWDFSPTPVQDQSLAGISAQSLRGHVSFLASDTLQGRQTPSYGQDVAAEYIAAQFRRAGLEPAGNEEYFQTETVTEICPNAEDFLFRLSAGAKTIEVPPANFSLSGVFEKRIDSAPVLKRTYADAESWDSTSLAGMVVFVELPPLPADQYARRAFFEERKDLIDRLTELGPLMIVLLDRFNRDDLQYFSGHALEPSKAGRERRAAAVPVAIISGSNAVRFFDEMREGSAAAALTMHLAKPTSARGHLRNVIGLLRGSDPALQDTYVFLTAHYDGTGPATGAPPGIVWNAANDNGSGVASILEIAAALAALPQRPRRSLVFMAFFGEEKGLLGASFYGAHPVFPIENTVAAINLEQVGRTDSYEGNQRGRATLTGFDYSEVGEILQLAGEHFGITVYKDSRASDQYFSRSDNQVLADLGVPSHSLSVALEFPDYHGAGDDWQLIDYENMAATARMTALAALMMAQSEKIPRWKSSNPRARPYIEAWERLHP